MKSKIKSSALVLLAAIGGYASYDRVTRPFFLQDLHHLAYKKLSLVSANMADFMVGRPRAKPICYANIEKLNHRIRSPLPWVVQTIDSGFSKFKEMSVESVERTFRESDPGSLLVLYRISKDGTVFEKRSKEMNGACNFAATYYQELFTEIARMTKIKDVTILLRLADVSSIDYSEASVSDQVPILAVTADSRHPIDRHSIFIPDYQNLLSWARLMPKMIQANKKSPWHTKKNIVFWRGGPADVSGYRKAVVELSERLHRNPIDAQFTYGEAKTSERVSQVDHVPFKYQLNIDGHTAAWERPVWQLFSNCVLVMPKSPYVQWYYHVLKPGVHYVEVPNDPGLLLKTLNAYSDEDLKRIAQRGHEFARDNLSIEDMIAHIALVLKAYSEKQNS